MQTEIIRPSKPRVSTLSSRPSRENRKARSHSVSISDSLTALRKRLMAHWRIGCASFRSFRGHIALQSAKREGWLDVGPACQTLDGHLQPNKRTLARAEGIENFRSNYGWADNVDLRVFLMGFDAGERYSTMSQDHQNIPEKGQTPKELDSCDQLS